jgi:hypothetical protein
MALLILVNIHRPYLLNWMLVRVLVSINELLCIQSTSNGALASKKHMIFARRPNSTCNHFVAFRINGGSAKKLIHHN